MRAAPIGHPASGIHSARPLMYAPSVRYRVYTRACSFMPVFRSSVLSIQASSCKPSSNLLCFPTHTRPTVKPWPIVRTNKQEEHCGPSKRSCTGGRGRLQHPKSHYFNKAQVNWKQQPVFCLAVFRIMIHIQ